MSNQCRSELNQGVKPSQYEDLGFYHKVPVAETIRHLRQELAEHSCERLKLCDKLHREHPVSFLRKEKVKVLFAFFIPRTDE
ncbi:hypothetical protein LguiA_016863 [Lonicera macranthoides]